MSNPLDKENNPLEEAQNNVPADEDTGAQTSEQDCPDTDEITGSEGYDDDHIVEGSTIFTAAPVETKSKKGGSRRLRNIIAAILVLCILSGSVFAIIKLIPVDETEETSSASSAIMSVEMVAVDESDIKSITVKNQYGEYTAYPDVTATVSSSSGSDTAWGIDGIGSELVNTTVTSGIALYASNISALRLMETGATDLSQYGFDNPYMTVDVAGYSSAADYKLYFGNDAPTGEGKYAHIEGSNDVYLVSSTVVTHFDVDKTYFINVTVFSSLASDSSNSSYFDESGVLTKFDSIVIGGTKHTTPIMLSVNPYDSSSYIPYLMTSPVQQNVMGTAGDKVLSPVKTGLTADGAYEIYPDAATIAKYGLDNPETVVTYTIGSYVKTLKIAEVEGDSSYYAVINDSVPVIYKIDKSTLTFASYAAEDYFNNYIFLDDITSISSISVSTLNGSHTYALTHGTDESGTATLAVMCDGKSLAADSFRNLYQFMISCYASEFTSEPATPISDSFINIKINYVDAARQSIDAKFVQSSDRRFHITVNGNPLGFAFASTVDDLITYENSYYGGGTVPTP